MDDIKPVPVVKTPSARNILFLTNSELGQCNVALAVAEEFLRRDEFNAHIASYRPLAPMVDELNKRTGASHPVKFHEIWGPCMTDLAIRSNVGLLFHPASLKGTVEGFKKVKRAISSWTPTEYARAYACCLEILDRLRPAVVVIDPILHVGLDACRTAKSRVVVLWPVPHKDVVILCQPKAAVLWKYPVYVTKTELNRERRYTDHEYQDWFRIPISLTVQTSSPKRIPGSPLRDGTSIRQFTTGASGR